MLSVRRSSNRHYGQTATIHVRVINGRTGCPKSAMSFAFVDYDTDGNGKYRDDLNGRKTVTTTVEGDSYIANADVHGVLVFNGMGSMDALLEAKVLRRQHAQVRRRLSLSSFYDRHLGLVARNDCSKRSAEQRQMNACT